MPDADDDRFSTAMPPIVNRFEKKLKPEVGPELFSLNTSTERLNRNGRPPESDDGGGSTEQEPWLMAAVEDQRSMAGRRTSGKKKGPWKKLVPSSFINLLFSLRWDDFLCKRFHLAEYSLLDPVMVGAHNNIPDKKASPLICFIESAKGSIRFHIDVVLAGSRFSTAYRDVMLDNSCWLNIRGLVVFSEE